MNDRADYLPTKTALDVLGVKPQTLYAYVSRGWIRSIAQNGTREKLYLREDVEKVKARSVARAGHGPAAATAMRWGEPVIHSSITEITPEGPRYRGRLATDLARTQQAFEATADFLWTGLWHEGTDAWRVEPPPAEFKRLADELVRAFPRTRFRQLLALVAQLLAVSQDGNPEARLGSAVQAARQLMLAMVGAFGYLAKSPHFAPMREGEGVAAGLARIGGVRATDDVLRALDAALIVSADHEFAPSTFAARIAASTGANLHACIISGIAAFDGALTGLGADQTEDLVLGCRTLADLRKRFQSLRDQGKRAPGFNHPLYAKGDPRALHLIELAQRIARGKRNGARADHLFEFLDIAGEEFDAYPALPVGLVAMQHALGLPQRSAGALFLIGRVSGWVAHVQEQRLAGFLLRPRAKYVP